MIDLSSVIAEARARGDYNHLLDALPYARFMGMRASLHEGRVRVHVPFRPMLIGNVALPSLHGGVAGACLETVALLELVHLEGGLPIPKTIDFTVDYLRAARPDDLFAVAQVERVGRRVAHVRMRAYQKEPDQPIALGRGNFMLD